MKKRTLKEYEEIEIMRRRQENFELKQIRKAVQTFTKYTLCECGERVEVLEYTTKKKKGEMVLMNICECGNVFYIPTIIKLNENNPKS